MYNNRPFTNSMTGNGIPIGSTHPLQQYNQMNTYQRPPNQSQIPMIGSTKAPYELTKITYLNNINQQGICSSMGTSICSIDKYKMQNTLMCRIEDYYLLRTLKIDDNTKQYLQKVINEKLINVQLIDFNNQQNLQIPAMPYSSSQISYVNQNTPIINNNLGYNPNNQMNMGGQVNPFGTNQINPFQNQNRGQQNTNLFGQNQQQNPYQQQNQGQSMHIFQNQTQNYQQTNQGQSNPFSNNQVQNQQQQINPFNNANNKNNQIKPTNNAIPQNIFSNQSQPNSNLPNLFNNSTNPFTNNNISTQQNPFNPTTQNIFTQAQQQQQPIFSTNNNQIVSLQIANPDVITLTTQQFNSLTSQLTQQIKKNQQDPSQNIIQQLQETKKEYLQTQTKNTLEFQNLFNNQPKQHFKVKNNFVVKSNIVRPNTMSNEINEGINDYSFHNIPEPKSQIKIESATSVILDKVDIPNLKLQNHQFSKSIFQSIKQEEASIKQSQHILSSKYQLNFQIYYGNKHELNRQADRLIEINGDDNLLKFADSIIYDYCQTSGLSSINFEQLKEESYFEFDNGTIIDPNLPIKIYSIKPSSEIKFIIKKNPQPWLTKPGYFTFPPIEDLKKFQLPQLQQVEQFQIYNQFGRIIWSGLTDISYLNINIAVTIEDATVEVYCDQYYQISKPVIGEKLNKQCWVTFYNSNAFNKLTQDGKIDHEFIQKKIEKICLINNIKLVEYDITNLTWTVELQHFTKYQFNIIDEEFTQGIESLLQSKMNCLKIMNASHQQDDYRPFHFATLQQEENDQAILADFDRIIEEQEFKQQKLGEMKQIGKINYYENEISKHVARYNNKLFDIHRKNDLFRSQMSQVIFIPNSNQFIFDGAINCYDRLESRIEDQFWILKVLYESINRLRILDNEQENLEMLFNKLGGMNQWSYVLVMAVVELKRQKFQIDELIMLWIELWNVLFGNAFICLRRLNVNKLQQCESFLRSYKESHDYFIKQKTEFTKVLSSIINYIYKNTHKRSEFDDILYFLPQIDHKILIQKNLSYKEQLIIQFLHSKSINLNQSNIQLIKNILSSHQHIKQSSLPLLSTIQLTLLFHPTTQNLSSILSQFSFKTQNSFFPIINTLIASFIQTSISLQALPDQAIFNTWNIAYSLVNPNYHIQNPTSTLFQLFNHIQDTHNNKYQRLAILLIKMVKFIPDIIKNQYLRQITFHSPQSIVDSFDIVNSHILQESKIPLIQSLQRPNKYSQAISYCIKFKLEKEKTQTFESFILPSLFDKFYKKEKGMEILKDKLKKALTEYDVTYPGTSELFIQAIECCKQNTKLSRVILEKLLNLKVNYGNIQKIKEKMICYVEEQINKY